MEEIIKGLIGGFAVLAVVSLIGAILIQWLHDRPDRVEFSRLTKSDQVCNRCGKEEWCCDCYDLGGESHK